MMLARFRQFLGQANRHKLHQINRLHCTTIRLKTTTATAVIVIIIAALIIQMTSITKGIRGRVAIIMVTIVIATVRIVIPINPFHIIEITTMFA